jgi:hypothetical protein
MPIFYSKRAIFIRIGNIFFPVHGKSEMFKHIFILSFSTQNKKHFKNLAPLVARAIFGSPLSLNQQYFSCKAWELKMLILHISTFLFLVY